MLFVFHALDGDNGPDIRSVNYPAHRAHLETVGDYGATIMMSGPLTHDDGQTPIGSFIIVDAPDRDAAENFFHADPFYKAGLWDETHITALKKVKG